MTKRSTQTTIRCQLNLSRKELGQLWNPSMNRSLPIRSYLTNWSKLIRRRLPQRHASVFIAHEQGPRSTGEPEPGELLLTPRKHTLWLVRIPVLSVNACILPINVVFAFILLRIDQQNRIIYYRLLRFYIQKKFVHLSTRASMHEIISIAFPQHRR